MAPIGTFINGDDDEYTGPFELVTRLKSVTGIVSVPLMRVMLMFDGTLCETVQFALEWGAPPAVMHPVTLWLSLVLTVAVAAPAQVTVNSPNIKGCGQFNVCALALPIPLRAETVAVESAIRMFFLRVSDMFFIKVILHYSTLKPLRF